MERVPNNNRPKKASAVLALGILIGSACSTDKTTVGEQIEAAHAKTVELCQEEAKNAFEQKYPDVSVPENPTSDQLRDALAVVEDRETNGATYVKDVLEDCVENNFNAFVDQLTGEELRLPDGVGIDAVTSTTEG